MSGTIYNYFASVAAAVSVPQLSVGDRAGLEYLEAGSIRGSKRDVRLSSWPFGEW